MQMVWFSHTFDHILHVFGAVSIWKTAKLSCKTWQEVWLYVLAVQGKYNNLVSKQLHSCKVWNKLKH